MYPATCVRRHCMNPDTSCSSGTRFRETCPGVNAALDNGLIGGGVD